MKRLLVLMALALGGLLVAAEVNVLERFDGGKCAGKLYEGAKLVEAGGLEKGMLEAAGNGKSNQVFYELWFDCAPGDKFALSFNYKTSLPYLNSYGMAEIVFSPVKGHKPIPTIYYRLGRTANCWRHKLCEFEIPEGVAKARVLLRMAGLKPDNVMWFDFLRLVSVKDGVAKGIHLSDFETTFDNWRFDAHLVYDHFMPGAGGAVKMEWKEAKVGEAFFQANGSEEPMQYSLWIENLSVAPERNYVFEAWYQATECFRFNAKGILIFFYKDAKGKAIGQSRFHIRNTDGKWKELLHAFTTPKGCAYLDIGLNMRKVRPDEYVRLDHMRFHAGKSAAFLRQEIDPEKQTLTLGNSVSSDISAKDIQAVTYRLEGEKGGFQRDIPGKLNESQTIGLADVPDGLYRLTLEVALAGGKKLADGPRSLMVCKQPSWTNDLGMRSGLKHAPAPWKDVKREGNAVVTWNQRFEFSPVGQLRALTEAGGTPLLSGPVEITVDGQSIFAEMKASPPVESPLAVAFGGADRGVVCAASVDFTGLAHYHVTVPVRQKAVDSFAVEFTVPEAEFVHRSDDSWTAVGAVDLKAAPEWSSKHFYNEVTVGGMERGITVYVPKLYPAAAEQPKPWVTVKREGKGARVRLSFVNQPYGFPGGKPCEFEFALAPYPFRPSENRWKTMRFRAGKNANFGLIWQTSKLFKYCGSTAEAADPAGLKRMIAEKKGTLLFYQFPFYIMDNIPEWSYFAKLWKGVPARAYDMRKQGGMAHKADIRQKTWVDFYLTTLKKHLDEYAWDGVYYDCFGTDIFTENGELFHPVFPTRAFQERVYLVQRLKNPASVTTTHMGASEFGTAAAYSNLVLMGEQYRGACARHTYILEFLTLDQFRYENAVNIGPDRMFLPQYHDPKLIASPKVATSLMGLVLAHNLMLYPNFIDSKTELSVRDRQFDFGMTDAEFYPYWKPQPDPVGTDNPALVTSYYKNPRGIFMTVLNPTGQPQRCTLKTNGKAATAFDPVAQQERAAAATASFIVQPYLALFVRIAP